MYDSEVVVCLLTIDCRGLSFVGRVFNLVKIKYSLSPFWTSVRYNIVAVFYVLCCSGLLCLALWFPFLYNDRQRDADWEWLGLHRGCSWVIHRIYAVDFLLEGDTVSIGRMDSRVSKFNSEVCVYLVSKVLHTLYCNG